jgi:hypothetical protein
VRTVDLVQGLALAVAAVAVPMAVAQRKLVRKLTRAGATCPALAAKAPAWNPLLRLAMRRLQGFGVLRGVPDGRVYVDTDVAAAWNRRRRRRALICVGVALTAALLVAWLER